jgi:Kinesin motor domain.
MIFLLVFRDLLSTEEDRKYSIMKNKEMGIFVKGLSSFCCDTSKKVEELLYFGNRRRSIG